MENRKAKAAKKTVVSVNQRLLDIVRKYLLALDKFLDLELIPIIIVQLATEAKGSPHKRF